MKFVTSLLILMDLKRDSYDSILVIVNWLTKMVYYKQVKVTINIISLAEVIINLVMKHYGLPDSIVTNQKLLFSLKFWLLLCYFLNIKRRLLTTFHLQINSQIKKQNNTIDAYLQVFINFKQNN